MNWNVACHVFCVIAVLIASFGRLASAATVSIRSDCVHRLVAGCDAPVRDHGTARGAPADPVTAFNGTTPLILTRWDGEAIRRAAPALAIARLFSDLPGQSDARLWMVEAERSGEVRVVCLRIQRQTWTAGRKGDILMGLPMAAMTATYSGALAYHVP